MSLPGFMRFDGSQRFELCERLHQLWSEHLWQQRGARLSVAVLAGEGTAVFEDYVGGFIDKLSILCNSFSGLEIEGEAEVHTALAEVPIHRRAIAVAIDQAEQIAQICAEKFGRNGGVFPAFAAVLLSGNEDAGSETGLANSPHALGFLGRVKAT